ncbi:MAG: hypothetical protein HC909_02995, partial [Blastochloris sp.]|nr:hypothetical protein [Blastochloris sp.]
MAAWLIAAMAERMAGGTAARLSATLDTGEVVLERDGLAMRFDTRFGVIALDEGLTPDERPPGALLDRLGIRLDLSMVSTRDAIEQFYESEDIAEARARLSSITVGDDVIEANGSASPSSWHRFAARAAPGTRRRPAPRRR